MSPTKLDSLTQPCHGLTGEMLLQKIEPLYEVELPLQMPTTLRIRVQYEGGEILCFPPRPAPPGSDAPDLPAHIEIEVTTHFETADGTFQEVPVTYMSGGEFMASLTASVPGDSLAGDFDPAMDGYEDVKVHFEANFSGPKTWGVITRTGKRPGKASERIPIAAWDNR